MAAVGREPTFLRQSLSGHEQTQKFFSNRPLGVLVVTFDYNFYQE